MRELAEKVLESKTVEKVYDDALSAPLKETGKLGRDLVKTARLFLAPFQVTAALQDRFEKFLDRVRNKVPEERQINAAPEIAGPVIEKLKYYTEENLITELFSNLLARAIDRDRVDEAHPAFAHLIAQLAPDEAVLLYEMRDKDFEIVDTMDYNRGTNQFFNRRIEKMAVPLHKLVFPANLELYYSHLQSMNLALWPVYKQDPIHANGVQSGIRRYSKLTLTDFGKLFVKACIPDDAFVAEFFASESSK